MNARDELRRRLEAGELTDAGAARALAAVDDDLAAVTEAESWGRLSARSPVA